MNMNDVQANEKLVSDPNPHIVQMLNDRFRTQGIGNGTVLVTAGVYGLGDAFVKQAYRSVQQFSDFSPDNDPWHEHDCASVTVLGEKLIWKIDYYNPDRTAGSENPADELMTHRVMTIMLASEY